MEEKVINRLLGEDRVFWMNERNVAKVVTHMKLVVENNLDKGFNIKRSVLSLDLIPREMGDHQTQHRSS